LFTGFTNHHAHNGILLGTSIYFRASIYH